MATRVTAADAAWYLGENPANPMMVSSVLWFDRPVDPDLWRERIEQRILVRHPVFRERIVGWGNPLLLRWEPDPDFDLDRHVDVVELPPPGDHADLEARCSVERSTPLDRQHPLWSMRLFQGYRGTGSAIHTRVHHSVGDGLALMQLLLTISDEFEPGSVPVVDDPELHLAHELLHRTEHAVAEASRLALHPRAVVDRARRAADAAAWGVRLLTPVLAPSSVLIGRPQGTKRMAWDPDGFDVDEVKAAGRAHGATVNDVLLTVMAGALHRYLAERDALVDEVLMVMPCNLRPPGEPLPRHLGNRIGLLPVLLPAGLEDRAARLAAVRTRTAALKDSPAPAVSRLLLAATSLVTPTVERAIHRLNQIRSTGVITNVPGPRAPLHLGGARMLGTVGWGGMTAHLNLSAAFISLGGRVFPGFVTDEAITPDPDRLLAHLREEWADWSGDRPVGARAADAVAVPG